MGIPTAQAWRARENQGPCPTRKLFISFWIPGYIILASVCECICQEIKVLMVLPFVIREVTMCLPGMVTCGCLSFNKRTRGPVGASWCGGRSLGLLVTGAWHQPSQPECRRRCTGQPLKSLGHCQVRTLSPKGLCSWLNVSLWLGQRRALAGEGTSLILR